MGGERGRGRERQRKGERGREREGRGERERVGERYIVNFFLCFRFWNKNSTTKRSKTRTISLECDSEQYNKYLVFPIMCVIIFGTCVNLRARAKLSGGVATPAY